MAPKAVQAKLQNGSKDKPRSKAKKRKKNTWNEGQTLIFVTVLPFLEGTDNPWALVLETFALKKSANESDFRKILEEFEDVLGKEGKFIC